MQTYNSLKYVLLDQSTEKWFVLTKKAVDINQITEVLFILQYSKPVFLGNPFPNKPWFLPVCSISFLKTLWEKKKLLVTSNFSFSHEVF